MSGIVKSIFVNYIVCAVFGGLLEYITPEKMRKTLRICVVSLMLLTSFAPVLQIDLDFENISYSEDIASQEQYNALMHTANLMEKKIYSQIKETLINSGVDEYEIYITTQESVEENTVYLEGISVEIEKESENKIPQIKETIPDEYLKVFEIGVKNE